MKKENNSMELKTERERAYRNLEELRSKMEKRWEGRSGRYEMEVYILHI